MLVLGPKEPPHDAGTRQQGEAAAISRCINLLEDSMGFIAEVVHLSCYCGPADI